MPSNRTYPAADGVDTWYADKSSSVSASSDVVVGTHVGPATAGGVSSLSAFEGYTPIHKVDSPSDGINDGKDYVTYFSKDGADPKELFKATNGDVSTLVALTTGTEFDNFYDYIPA